MSIVSKRPPAERETPTPRVRDHEHVSRLSTQTTIFALIAVALILYEIQWILPPFVFAALLAYITTPAIEWASARTRLPRVLFVLLHSPYSFCLQCLLVISEFRRLRAK